MTKDAKTKSKHGKESNSFVNQCKGGQANRRHLSAALVSKGINTWILQNKSMQEPRINREGSSRFIIMVIIIDFVIKNLAAVR